jgi:hypothetical protein
MKKKAVGQSTTNRDIAQAAMLFSVASVLLIPRFFVAREDFVPRASRPCSSMAGTAMARFWLRLCRAVRSVVNLSFVARIEFRNEKHSAASGRNQTTPS